MKMRKFIAIPLVFALFSCSISQGAMAAGRADAALQIQYDGADVNLGNYADCVIPAFHGIPEHSRSMDVFYSDKGTLKLKFANPAIERRMFENGAKVEVWLAPKTAPRWHFNPFHWDSFLSYSKDGGDVNRFSIKGPQSNSNSILSLLGKFYDKIPRGVKFILAALPAYLSYNLSNAAYNFVENLLTYKTCLPINDSEAKKSSDKAAAIEAAQSLIDDFKQKLSKAKASDKFNLNSQLETARLKLAKVNLLPDAIEKCSWDPDMSWKMYATLLGLSWVPVASSIYTYINFLVSGGTISNFIKAKFAPAFNLFDAFDLIKKSASADFKYGIVLTDRDDEKGLSNDPLPREGDLDPDFATSEEQRKKANVLLKERLSKIQDPAEAAQLRARYPRIFDDLEVKLLSKEKAQKISEDYKSARERSLQKLAKAKPITEGLVCVLDAEHPEQTFRLAMNNNIDGHDADLFSMALNAGVNLNTCGKADTLHFIFKHVVPSSTGAEALCNDAAFNGTFISEENRKLKEKVDIITGNGKSDGIGFNIINWINQRLAPPQPQPPHAGGGAGQPQPQPAGGVQPQQPGGVQPQQPGGVQPQQPGGVQPQQPGGVQPQQPGGGQPQQLPLPGQLLLQQLGGGQPQILGQPGVGQPQIIVLPIQMPQAGVQPQPGGIPLQQP
ncbi:MAG: hypothetical protein RUMPE_00633 [Eubacteriales bacterium SKADARSKE-1]|nr:hypothetical protein [Eubacteriales bacterium SKADARSKE-1]